MRVEWLKDAESVAKRGAAFLAEEARSSVAERGRFLLAVSGGKTPWKMFRALAKESVPWDRVHVFQVDERVAPAEHPDRNLTPLRQILLASTPLTGDQIHGMPVEFDHLEAGATRYADTLRAWGGPDPVLDVVHLGLGVDGHTASLFPSDPVAETRDKDVAVTEPHFGRQRMTLTFPAINRARRVLWLVTGVDKGPALRRLQRGDPAIPAGRVQQTNALLLTDTDPSDPAVSLPGKMV